MTNRRRKVDFEAINADKTHYHKLPFKEGLHYVVRNDTGCWEWILPYSTRYPSWRGCFTHQLSYCIGHSKHHYNTICHKCDNPGCINPAHLYDGTATDNARDKSYITLEQALMVMAMKDNGLTLSRIAQTLEIGIGVIKSISMGKHWITKTDEFRKVR